MLVLPISSKIHTLFVELSQTRRMVFMAGLPGVGKSLLIQQLAIVAHEAGRKVHSIQWDVSRKAFEVPEILNHYPEIGGVTDPMIRKGVGMWARTAVQEWNEQYPEPEHLLIGEVPLIGNRLIELTQVIDDNVEGLLSSEQAAFVVPVPSWEVRAVIEKAREESIANPKHENEKMDAAPAVLRGLWQGVNELARQMQITKAGDNASYNPYIYAGVYEALLQHRQAQTLLIDQVLRPKKSVYELDVIQTVLSASHDEAIRCVRQLEADYSREELVTAVKNWHSTITANPKPVDPGPELLLPLPEALNEDVAQTILTAEQTEALQKLHQLPVEATAAELLPVIDEALATLATDGEVTAANVHKFDVYDSYFNVKRTADDGGVVFLHGMLQSYRQMLANLDTKHDLTLIELSLLRIALDTVLSLLLSK